MTEKITIIDSDDQPQWKVKLPNTQETFDWLHKEADNRYWIDQENMEMIEVVFQIEALADRSMEELPQLEL